jgi:hypothetical protein
MGKVQGKAGAGQRLAYAVVYRLASSSAAPGFCDHEQLQ